MFDSSRSLTHRLSLLFSGWVFIAAAVSAVLRANLGGGPFDVLNTAIAEQLHIQVGTASWLSTSVVLLAAVLLGARPGVATFAAAFCVGALINALLPVIPTPSALVLRLVMLAVAVAVLYLGIALVVVSGMGAGAIDLLMFALESRGVPLVVARWALEISAALTGLLLGGSAGLATVLIAVTVGPSLQRLIPRLDASRLGSSRLGSSRPGAPRPVATAAA
jgi:uncharacterized membrane protein YczE